MCNPNSSCDKWFHLISSGIGILFGVSAFFAFSCVYTNNDAATWAFLSMVFAAVTFHLHYLHMKQKLDTWHSVETLEGFKSLGMLALTCGVGGTVWYIFLAQYHHIPIVPVDGSMYIAAVWTFMTAKWGLTLFLCAHMYTNFLLGHRPPLISI